MPQPYDDPAMPPRTIYALSGGAPIAASPLQGDLAADIAVVGGGFVGISAALHAAEAGAPVFVQELAKRHGIDVQAMHGGIISAAHTPAALKKFQQRAQYCQSQGAPVDCLDRDEAAAAIGSDFYLGAMPTTGCISAAAARGSAPSMRRTWGPQCGACRRCSRRSTGWKWKTGGAAG